MVYMDYVYFNISMSGSLRVGQSLQTTSNGYSTYAREAKMSQVAYSDGYPVTMLPVTLMTLMFNCFSDK
jgi:hypothetical protein